MDKSSVGSILACSVGSVAHGKKFITARVLPMSFAIQQVLITEVVQPSTYGPLFLPCWQTVHPPSDLVPMMAVLQVNFEIIDGHQRTWRVKLARAIFTFYAWIVIKLCVWWRRRVGTQTYRKISDG